VPQPSVEMLQFLTAEDRRLLLEQARHLLFARGEVILAEGSRTQAIFLVLRGFVRVERSHLGQGIAIARRGPGVFGDISFVDGGAVSASVIADVDDVEVAVIDGALINSLLMSVPGLATRFYQSLAMTLSERLRDLTASLPPLIVEDVPQVNRFPAQRSGRPGHADIPPDLIDALDEFKTTLLSVDRAIKDRKLGQDDAQSRVSSACARLEDALREQIRRDGRLEAAIGSHVFRESFPFLMLSRFVDRAFTKPRGYAGDYATIEMLYDNVAAGDGRLGPLIDRWTLDVPAAQAVQNRRVLMARAIRAIAAERRSSVGPTTVTSLAAGPARELFDVVGADDAPDLLATCVDIDNEALAYASAIARKRGVADRFVFVQDNIVRLCLGRGHTELAPQALIYSIGLTDYLQDAFVINLINWAYDRLLPGGTLIIGNVVPTNPDKAYMDHILEWVLIHRSAEEMRELFRRSRFGATPVRLEMEPAGVDIFAFCTKA
jgi:extracellular factor (EF) 3-hydroxypalmitic acid methyl ester biosynthesis protein